MSNHHGMPAFRVTFKDGTSYATSMAKGTTLESARAYFFQNGGALTQPNESIKWIATVTEVCACEHGSTCDVSHNPATCKCSQCRQATQGEARTYGACDACGDTIYAPGDGLCAMCKCSRPQAWR